MHKIIFFISFIFLIILIYVIILSISKCNFIEKLQDKKIKNISLHIIMLKKYFNLSKIEEIILLSNKYSKHIDIYIYSDEKFDLKNNFIPNTYNHNYQNGRIIKIICDSENSIENIKSKAKKILQRQKKNYDMNICVTEKDFVNLKKFLTKKINYFIKKFEIL